jgi:hypothetical protein
VRQADHRRLAGRVVRVKGPDPRRAFQTPETEPRLRATMRMRTEADEGSAVPDEAPNACYFGCVK